MHTQTIGEQQHWRNSMCSVHYWSSVVVVTSITSGWRQRTISRKARRQRRAQLAWWYLMAERIQKIEFACVVAAGTDPQRFHSSLANNGWIVAPRFVDRPPPLSPPPTHTHILSHLLLLCSENILLTSFSVWVARLTSTKLLLKVIKTLSVCAHFLPQIGREAPTLCSNIFSIYLIFRSHTLPCYQG